MTLVHAVYTDTLEIRLAGELGRGRETDERFYTTLAFALRDATATYLGASPREIGAQAYQAAQDDGSLAWAMVLYDQVPGGAGFMQSMQDALPELLLRTLDRLEGDPSHHHECVAACPRCLISYQTQFALQLLDRSRVLAHFDSARRVILRPSDEFSARFGPRARAVFGGIDGVLHEMLDAERAAVFIADLDDRAAEHPMYRALLKTAERNRKALLLNGRTPDRADSTNDRALNLALQRFILAGGEVRLLPEAPAHDEAFGVIERRGETISFGLLAPQGSATSFVTSTPVRDLPPERAERLLRAPGPVNHT